MIQDLFANGPLFIDPNEHVALYLFVSLMREWQQLKGMVPWSAARIELELGDKVSQVRDTRQGRSVKIVAGVSKADPVASERKAQAEALAKQEAAEETERRAAELKAAQKVHTLA